MDQLCAAGELVWIGAGAMGRSSGRVALYFREDLPALGPPSARGTSSALESPAHEAVRARLAAGACFFTDLLVDVDLAPEEIQEALWDLAWAGEATNDAFAPLRAPRLTLARAQRERVRGAARPGRFAARRRGAGASAQVQGRWSLTEPLFRGAVDPAARRRAIAELLLERYGILTRETVRAEGLPGGFSGIYPELSQLETLGVARRGYFVEGLGGAQFALPGAVERLRADSADHDAPVVLAAVDPAQPYGAALAWPARSPADSRRPMRVAGAYVVLAGGEPILYVERGGRALQTLVGTDDPRVETGLHAVVEQVRSGRIRRLAFEKVDGEPALASPLGPALVALGFQQGPRRLTLSA
jgi:ATP-dependent Lhr-like helicase